MFVSLSPAERAKNVTHMLPFFRAIKAEHIGIIIDIASRYLTGPFSSTQDYMGAQKLPFLKIGPVHNMVNKKNQRGPPTRWYRVVEFDGHTFVHYKITDWPDGEALPLDNAILINEEVDYMAMLEPTRSAIVADDLTRICVHCNGGLGRAPTFVCLRVLWNAAKLASTYNIPRTCKFHHQKVISPACPVKSKKDGDSKEEATQPGLNLAAVLRNILIRGYYTRSVFVQTDVQNAMLKPFAKKMAKHKFIDKSKHTT